MKLIMVTACVAVLSVACRVEAPERSQAEERAQATGYRGILLSDADARPDFVLTDMNGEAFHFRAETEGKLALLFFGYTYCPDVCPVHMASIAAVKRDLSVAEQRRMRVVFVTADPRRDTAERLLSWLGNFDPDFVGLRGTEAEVDSIMLGLALPAAGAATRRHGQFRQLRIIPLAHWIGRPSSRSYTDQISATQK